MIRPWNKAFFAFIVVFVLCISCSEDDPSILPPEEDTTDPISTVSPFQELYDQGLDKYLGLYSPASSVSVGAGVTIHRFTDLDGPVCYTGNEFNMSTRDGQQDELIIFLQGGGVCGPRTCDAVDSILNLLPVGILSLTPDNPAFGWDVGYVPYCDGSLFTGDNEVDSNGDGVIDRQYRGLKNLSAALDVIKSTYANPSRILLTGNSAGGMGVHFALPLVRKLYPELAIDVVNDSGIGLFPQGVLPDLITEWNADVFFPESCSDCVGEDGHLTGYQMYQLAQDKNIRMGFISSKEDWRVSPEFGDGPGFQSELSQAMERLNEAHPERFGSLIANGDAHTFILRDFDYEIAGTSVRKWIDDMLMGTDAWMSLSD